MDDVPRKKTNSTNLIKFIITAFLIFGMAVTTSLEYLTGSVYAQQQATLTVITRVVCNPSTPDCPTPSQFTIGVTGNNPNPSSFPGSSEGTNVMLGPGDFFVDVVGTPEDPPEGYTLNNNFENCDGTIAAGESRQCVITATYFQPSTLRVIKQVECPTGVVCPPPSAFTIRVTGNPASPNSFPGSSEGTSVLLGLGSFSVNEVVGSQPNPPGHVLVPPVLNNCNGVVNTPGQQLADCVITNRYLQDTDGDGLPDTWEINGIDINNDGTIDFTLPGADPRHKNLYIEADFMEFHRPVGGGGAFGAIQDLRSAFNRAPVSNPDGINGINLFVLVDEQIPHQDEVSFEDFETNLKNTWFGTAAERASPNAVNLLAAKRLAFHYTIFAHGIEGREAMGVGNQPGMNFIITLGGVSSALDPITNHPVGTRSEQSTTFMHELGHNLNLDHGGNEGVNCKTNYISIMNDMTTEGVYIDDAPLDYSASALPPLNKGALIEQNGIGQSNPPGLMTVYNGPGEPFKGPRLTAAGVPVDFNFNDVIDQQPVSSDINGGLTCGTPGPPSATGTLNGFNDWGSPLLYVTTTGQLNAPLQAAADSEPVDITSEEVEDAPEGLTALQVEEPEQEPTYEKIKEARIDLLEGIDNAILRLGGEINTFDIFEDLQFDQLDAAIAKLLQLKAQVIADFGEEAANREVVPLIDNLVGVLEKQKYPSTPPESACIGDGSVNRIITGTPDPDTLIGTSGNNIINGLGGDDRINGCAGNDSINGGEGDDGLAGGPGNDDLHGDEGDDVIQGDSGNDQLIGGPGVNVLTGGPGRDSFVCSPDGVTTITDFVPRTDVITGPCILADATSSAVAVAEMSTTSIISSTSSIPLEILPLPLPD